MRFPYPAARCCPLVGCTVLVWRPLAQIAIGACLTVAAATIQAETQALPDSVQPSLQPQKAADDVTNQSPRERNRVLLKRNPIASEYQSSGPPGDVPGASTDAEGVDFRARFRLPEGKAEASSFKVEGNVSYQGASQEAVPGGSLSLEKSIGSLAVQFQAQQNASERIVDLYQARWLDRTEPLISDDDVFLLGFPRYTRDYYDTTSIDTRWRLDYSIGDDARLTYEGLATNYDDEFVRDRLEFQNVGVSDQLALGADGSTITQAVTQSSRLRRYFHRMETARDIQRHRFAFTLDGEKSSTELGVYYSRWVNQRIWLPWNFVDNSIESTYRIDDRYLPDAAVTNADLFDVSASSFANFRPSDTTTTDTDYAFHLDWDRQLMVDKKVVWMGAGVTWRTKERDNVNERAVYVSGVETFALDQLTGSNGPTRVIEDGYTIPARLDTRLADAYFQNNRDAKFSLNLSQSFLESIQDVYSSEETVGSAYVNAYQQWNAWFWRIGLRYEKTKSETRGAVSGPPGSGISETGEAIASIELEGQTVVENFAGFDAAFVQGSNRYDHWLPSVELRYSLNAALELKAAYFEQLMRPQYFDTVRYRRINPPTRTINEGSPDLKPTSVRNLYVGFEYDYSEQSRLAVGAYYKRVSDFFYDTRVTELLDGVVYDVSRVENGDDGSIKGVQVFTSHRVKLPNVESANVELSYTFSDAEADLINRTIDMPERSEHLVALNLRLANKQWQYQSKLSWQSEALDNVGPGAAQDIFREAVLVWDQSFSWRFNKHWLTRLSLNNVLDYPDRSYQGSESRVVDNQFSDYSARISVVFAH